MEMNRWATRPPSCEYESFLLHSVDQYKTVECPRYLGRRREGPQSRHCNYLTNCKQYHCRPGMPQPTCRRVNFYCSILEASDRVHQFTSGTRPFGSDRSSPGDLAISAPSKAPHIRPVLEGIHTREDRLDADFEARHLSVDTSGHGIGRILAQWPGPREGTVQYSAAPPRSTQAHGHVAGAVTPR